MARAPIKHVVANWNKYYEDFETSPRDFYTAVEADLEYRKIPGVKSQRILFTETGALSAKREYLRFTWRHLVFDVCAAPFGNGFFFSWWASQRPPSASGVFAAFLAFAGLVFGSAVYLGGFVSRLIHPFVIPIYLWPVPLETLLFWIALVWFGFFLFALTARLGWDAPDRHLQAVPVIGWVYGRIFAPLTYFWIDSLSIGRAAMQAAVYEAINQVTTAKGLRALSEEERKPIFRELVGRSRRSVRAA
jgi:hypothetical protein